MDKDKMLTTASDTKLEVPEAFSRNVKKLPEWVFNLRRTLYCKAKQEPKYRFYTLYNLVCRKDVIEAGWQMVSRNKGAPGIDGVRIADIENSPGRLEEFLEAIRQELITKTYQPQAVKRVYIPKANGKLRPLGIPTVKDRVVQAAVLTVIEPIFEADFLECSHGFRPGRSAHEALDQIQQGIRAGCQQAYDADMESYFDSIPHDKLIACVERRITDGSIIKLLRMWLRSLVVEDSGDGKPPRYTRPKQGTPQGGVISPLLANLYLHFFDVMFYKESGPGTWDKARLVRYADDFVILAKSVGSEIQDFVKESLEARMGLKINLEKTRIVELKAKGYTLEFLGYVFRHEKALRWNGWYTNLLPSKKSIKRIKAQLSELTTSKYVFKPIEEILDAMNSKLSGWANYFSKGSCLPAYKSVDQHAQLRLIKHLQRRSQRAYRRPKDSSWYEHLESLGYQRLSKRLRPRES